MKKLYADLVQELTTTAGAGSVTLTQMTGWVRFNDRFSAADRVYYSIRDGNNWEVGFGTYNGANVLARTTIIGTLAAGTWTSGGAALTLAGTGAIVRAVVGETLLNTLWKRELALISTNTSLVEGFEYGVQANSLTLTLPATPAVNDRIGIFQGAAAITGTLLDPGTNKINAQSGVMTIDAAEFSFTVCYISAAYGWKVFA
jgi:hypothetical protein